MIDENKVSKDLEDETKTPEERIQHIKWCIEHHVYVVEDFYEMDGPDISSRDAREVVKFKLREQLEDISFCDSCGAPWVRVEERYLKSVYNNIDKWWNDDVDTILFEIVKNIKKYFRTQEIRLEVSYDPECCGDETLWLVPIVDCSWEEAIKRMDNFDKEFWLEHSKNYKRISIDVGYAEQSLSG